MKFRVCLRSLRVLVQSELDDLGKVQGAAVGGLGNLLTTTEAVCDNHRALVCLAHGGQQDAFATGDGDLVVVLLEAEWAGHATAPGVEYLVVEAELLEY